MTTQFGILIVNNSLIAQRSVPELPDKAVLPPLSQLIADSNWLVLSQKTPAESAKTEAQATLLAAAELFSRPTDERVKNWLLRINLASSQPIAAADFNVRSIVIVDALVTLPAAVFTAETAREATMRFKWFPGAQEVAEFLAPRARRVREFEASLRRVAFCQLVEPEPRPEPSQAEREAVAAALASIGIRPAPDFQRPERTVEEQIAAVRNVA